jgi:hypothetical protein
MARSGSYDFSLARDEIINEAFFLIGVLGESQTASTARLTQAGKHLNMMIKAWQAEGIGLWLNKEIVLMPQADTVMYYLGPAADSTYGSYACLKSDLVKTEVATAADAAAVTIEVDDATGMSTGYTIGIETSNGDIHWASLDAVVGSTLTIGTALDYGVTVDSHVYFSTSWSTQRPLEIIDCWTRDADENDIPMGIESLQRYRQLANKTTEGRPTMISPDYQLDAIIVYLWPEPEDMKVRTHLVVKYPVQDFDSSTDDADFPQEWYEALTYNIAVRLAPLYGRTPSEWVTAVALSSYENLKSFDREQTSVYFKPNPRNYRARRSS